MNQPLDVVLKFFDSWSGTPDGLETALQQHLAKDAVWENVGLSRTVGIKEALDFTRQFMTTMSVHHMSVDVLHIAAVGDVVLTERIDYLHAADNTVLGSFRVMGALEVRDGRVVQWRDYFDTAAVKP